MNLKLAYSVLDVLHAVQDATRQLKDVFSKKEMESFNIVSGDIEDGLIAIQKLIKQEVPKESRVRLFDACTCALESLKDIKELISKYPEKVEWKLEYELAAIIEIAAVQFYYWGIVEKNPEKRIQFLEYIKRVDTFRFLDNYEQENKFEYDLVISVLAYNKLEYTKQCVQSILDNLPKDVKYELVLINHGSTDGTKEYFESIKDAKVINISINGGVPGIAYKAHSEGRYMLSISNDVIIGSGAIDNLYRCVIENEDYGFVVPSTSAVSNLQTIPISYGNIDEFKEFTIKNNVYNHLRHEQRVRLCNPVTIAPMSIFLRMTLEMYEALMCNTNINSFPDDKCSFWMRRNGFKSILAKDAYCHHFGSVTIREELQNNEKAFYRDGREDFYQQYGIDPWGTGFCYDKELFRSWEFPVIDNAIILGINCGLGSNSLKIKEILKEKNAKGMVLYNATQDGRFLYDLQGVSDKAYLFWNLNELIDRVGIRKYNYIIVDDPIQGGNGKDTVEKMLYAGIEFDELVWRNSNGNWECIKRVEK